MVILAQSSPGCRSARASQSKTATVMLRLRWPILIVSTMGSPRSFTIAGRAECQRNGQCTIRSPNATLWSLSSQVLRRPRFSANCTRETRYKFTSTSTDRMSRHKPGLPESSRSREQRDPYPLSFSDQRDEALPLSRHPQIQNQESKNVMLARQRRRQLPTFIPSSSSRPENYGLL